jgi:uncharacterized damage-inducible protein DinB
VFEHRNVAGTVAKKFMGFGAGLCIRARENGRHTRVSFVPTPFEELLKLNTRLFLNCLDGIDDRTARDRPNDRTNSLAFIAAHVLDARFYLARCLGADVRNPFDPLLAHVQTIEDVRDLPSLEEMKSVWMEIANLLETRLAAVTENELTGPSPQPFPLESGGTILGALAFLLQHESFHIGQMAMLRKFYGFSAMNY